MVAITSTSPYAAYQGYQGTIAGASSRASGAAAATTAGEPAAATVTLSEAAQAALAERSFAAILADARDKLDGLLADAGRTSPLQGGRLAVDLSGLDARELYAVASDDSFTAEEREAAGLEMQRRFDAALAGPAAIAEVTGSFVGLYKAAAAWLDGLGPEERDSADWKASRDAVTEGLRQLQSAPGTLPSAGDSDPVALYLALADAGQTGEPALDDLAGSARRALDRLYAQAIANGRAPTFNRATTTGTYIDLSGFSSRTLSAIALDQTGRFDAAETRAAQQVLREKSGAALLSGFQNAAKSGDPTAFSQNVIAAFASLSAEERQAAGWSDQLYQAAVESYATTTKLMDMFTQAGGGNTGFLSWMGR